MALSFVIYPGNGTQTDFAVPFPYIAQSHVKVSVNGVDRPYRWVNSGLIRVDIVPPANSGVKVYRETPLEPLVGFTDGSTLTAEELNLVNRQNLYISQESYERFKKLIDDSFEQVVGAGPVSVEEIIAAATQQILESPLLADLNQRITDIDLNAETILEQTDRVDVLQETVDALANIDGQSLVTVIQNETNARIAGDTAIVDTIDLIGAASGDGLSFILNLGTVKVSPTETLGSRLSGIDTRFGQNEAALVTEQTTRASADSALSTQITNLSSTVTTNNNTLTARIATEETTRASADSALSNTLALLGSKNGANTAFVLNTATTFVDSTTSMASRFSALSAADSSNTARISTLETVTTGPGGLTAQWMVKTDVNGRVAGFGLYNNGATSDFIVLANKFAVVEPGTGKTPKVPFLVSGGVVYMQNVVIQDALIDSLTVNKLTSGSLVATITQNADINVGTGRIIWNNGTYMKVAGVGFGTSGQFIEWFGPKKNSPTLCSETDAIYYLKTNGEAYFGGTLSAGTITNKGQTTDQSSSAEIVVGPFGSNGGSIVVACSYTFNASYLDYVNGSCPAASNPTATVRLYRKVGTGSEVQVASRNITGNFTCTAGSPGQGEPRRTAETMSESFTYTDSLGVTTDRTYRLALTARSIWHSSSYINSQNLSIVATEE